MNIRNNLKGTDIIFSFSPQTKEYTLNFDKAPNSIVWDEDNELKSFVPHGDKVGFSIAIIGNHSNVIMHPLLDKSLFTRLFFYKGKTVEDYFELFAETRDVLGNRIYIWRTKWN